MHSKLYLSHIYGNCYTATVVQTVRLSFIRNHISVRLMQTESSENIWQFLLHWLGLTKTECFFIGIFSFLLFVDICLTKLLKVNHKEK